MVKIDSIDKGLKLLNEKETEAKVVIEKLNQMEVKFDLLIKQRDEKIEHLEMQLKDTNLTAFEQDKSSINRVKREIAI